MNLIIRHQGKECRKSGASFKQMCFFLVEHVNILSLVGQLFSWNQIVLIESRKKGVIKTFQIMKIIVRNNYLNMNVGL